MFVSGVLERTQKKLNTMSAKMLSNILKKMTKTQIDQVPVTNAINISIFFESIKKNE